MFDVAARAGFGLAILFAVLSTIFSVQQVTHALTLFVIAGVIPGTDIAVPSELVLAGVGAVLMATLLASFSRHAVYRTVYHALLDRLFAKYPRARDDPAVRKLVAGFSQLSRLGRMAVAAANDASAEIHSWLRSLGRPAIAQAIHVRRGLTPTLFRLSRRQTAPRANLARRIETLVGQLYDWADKAKSYLERLTIR